MTEPILTTETGRVLAQATCFFFKEGGFAELHLPDTMQGVTIRFEVPQHVPNELELVEWRREPVTMSIGDRTENVLHTSLRGIKTAPASVYTRQVFGVRSVYDTPGEMVSCQEVLTIDISAQALQSTPVVVRLEYVVSYRREDLPDE